MNVERMNRVKARTVPVATVLRPVLKIQPQPWPLVLKLTLLHFAKHGDRGAGDIIARSIGPIGGDAFKKWYKTIFGKGCGCGARQEVLNQRWPL